MATAAWWIAVGLLFSGAVRGDDQPQPLQPVLSAPLFTPSVLEAPRLPWHGRLKPVEPDPAELADPPAVLRPTIAFEGLPDELIEGRDVHLRWAANPAIRSVAVIATWSRLSLGGRPRGERTLVVQEAAALELGGLDWTVPWCDTLHVMLRAKGFGFDGKVAASTTVALPYRPEPMSERREDGLYVWLSGPYGQRLYHQEGGLLTDAAVCSGAEGGTLVPAYRHPLAPHDHFGVFKVGAKEVDHRSSLNNAWRMRYVLRYLNGHAIHATDPRMYRYLGEPASHGCIRLHLVDARRLYSLCPLGTRVEVF